MEPDGVRTISDIHGKIHPDLITEVTQKIKQVMNKQIEWGIAMQWSTMDTSVPYSIIMHPFRKTNVQFIMFTLMCLMFTLVCLM